MPKISRGQAMADAIFKIKSEFVSMSEDDRIRFIENYGLLNNYQRVALIQLKKFMTPKEKRVYKTQVEKQTQKESEQPDGPS